LIMMTMRSTLQTGKNLLKNAAILSYNLDAELLMMHAMEARGREAIFLQATEEISPELYENFMALIMRRSCHEPISYITGKKEFWSLTFDVTKDVLIPRPDSELIIEEAMKHLDPALPIDILDLGTGSGCLIISLLHEYRTARGVGCDISEAALSVAKQNAQLIEPSTRLELRISDWFSAIEPEEKFHLIVSNPPYITVQEMEGLQLDVRNFEPHLALTDGADGMRHYRAIIERLTQHLHENGVVLFECGRFKHNEVAAMLQTALPHHTITIIENMVVKAVPPQDERLGETV
jgi:release factor glutamine methyltransferase